MWRMQPGERCERISSMSMVLKAATRAREVRFWGVIIFLFVIIGFFFYSIEVVFGFVACYYVLDGVVHQECKSGVELSLETPPRVFCFVTMEDVTVEADICGG